MVSIPALPAARFPDGKIAGKRGMKPCFPAAPNLVLPGRQPAAVTVKLSEPASAPLK